MGSEEGERFFFFFILKGKNNKKPTLPSAYARAKTWSSKASGLEIKMIKTPTYFALLVARALYGLRAWPSRCRGSRRPSAQRSRESASWRASWRGWQMPDSSRTSGSRPRRLRRSVGCRSRSRDGFAWSPRSSRRMGRWTRSHVH